MIQVEVWNVLMKEKNGYIVSKGDINKAAELIIDTKWKYTIEFNKSKFSKNSMIRSYIELYENL